MDRKGRWCDEEHDIETIIAPIQHGIRMYLTPVAKRPHPGSNYNVLEVDTEVKYCFFQGGLVLGFNIIWSPSLIYLDEDLLGYISS